MSIFKRTQGNIITTNLKINPEQMRSRNFKISDIIDHLCGHESHVVSGRAVHKELFEVCINALNSVSDETVFGANTHIAVPSMGSVRTLFYPSCRIIQVNLTPNARLQRTSVRQLTTEEHECGYKMRLTKGAVAAIVIKIERMTDSSCFASWSFIS